MFECLTGLAVAAIRIFDSKMVVRAFRKAALLGKAEYGVEERTRCIFCGRYHSQVWHLFFARISDP